MKLIFSIILFFLTVVQLCKAQPNNVNTERANYIDSIQTATQIEYLIINIDDRFKEFRVNRDLKFSERTCQKLCDSLNVKPWQKADFDHNGLTDILVIGNWYDHAVLCILDKGNSKYEIKSITRRSFQECTFPLVKKGEYSNFIEYYFQNNQDRGNLNKPRTLEKVFLVYRFGDFIEYNVNAIKHNIEKIEYQTSGCYGTCPIFTMTINQDKSSIWNAERYNEINGKEVKGIFKTAIDNTKLQEITDLLNYIDFEKLNSSYAVGWTDDQSCILKITYDGGKTKSISDYGLIGTFGLDRVYQLLFALRENQKWGK